MRNIPEQAQMDLAVAASTYTRVLRVNLPNGTSYGICMSNADVTYDHGDGALTYVAANAFDPTTFSSDVAYSVDNAEGYALISNDIPGVTVDMVDAGQLDGGSWICYYVNYLNPTPGSAVILDAGDLGQVRTQFGMVWIPELLSYAMRLQQSVGNTYSRTCRAIFGTVAASPQGCGIDATPLWLNFTVTSVGAEDDRSWSDSSLVAGDHPFNPGRIQWLTGQNASITRIYSVENVDTDGEITQFETTPYAIQVGDTGRIRPDCDKTVANCNAYGNFLNMKAEPLIPVGDTAAIQVPGAQT
jgi:uncharacterized phage protein (TIGR02218 family)